MSFSPLKPFLKYDEQLDLLINDKKLLIPDVDKAKDALGQIGYNSLIGGYKELLYNPLIGQYIPGASFEHIINLYDFDEELRALFFKYICHIERNMRNHITYNFSAKYSHRECDYLNPNNYSDSAKNKNQINKLISILSNEANKGTDHPYIVYQRKKYGEVPLWHIVNTLTFGQISKMYFYLKPDVQTMVSKNFLNVNEHQLSQFLKFLSHYRNVCAHNERLYTYKNRVDIPDTSVHKRLGIMKKGNQYICGKNDLFALVITFKFLLSDDEFKSFKKELVKMINKVVASVNVIDEQIILHAMGFPNNWKDVK